MGVQCGPASHLTHNTHTPQGSEAVWGSLRYMLWGFVLGETHTRKLQQRRGPVTAKGAIQLGKALAHRPPGQSKATDGIVIARDFWQRGAPRARRWPGPNPKKWSSWVGFLWFPFSQALRSQGRKVNLSTRSGCVDRGMGARQEPARQAKLRLTVAPS